MTTIITRIYRSNADAEAAAAELDSAGHPRENVDIVSEPDIFRSGRSLAQRIADARVGKASAGIYEAEVRSGRTLLVVRAPVVPFGAARNAIAIVDRHEPLYVSGVVSNEYIRERPKTELFLSILPDHNRGTVSEAFGLRTLSPRRPRTSAMSGGGYMSKLFWPMPLLSRKQRRSSVIHGGAHMSRFFWPMPLVARRRAR
ncbi:MAG: hypothetical protein MUE98_11565 [Rhodobacteraceae bacterium]|nr:hypothetical protein [Paracoccaceae bacterium]